MFNVIPRSTTLLHAKNNFSVLLDMVLENGEIIQITTGSGSALLISEEKMRGISETLYLSSIPGMVESIKEAAAEPFEDCVRFEDINWDEI